MCVCEHVEDSSIDLTHYIIGQYGCLVWEFIGPEKVHEIKIQCPTLNPSMITWFGAFMRGVIKRHI